MRTRRALPISVFLSGALVFAAAHAQPGPGLGAPAQPKVATPPAPATMVAGQGGAEMDPAARAAALKAAVCSPRGTTEAGLAAMETADGLPRVVAAGVRAAHRRARELAVA